MRDRNKIKGKRLKSSRPKQSVSSASPSPKAASHLATFHRSTPGTHSRNPSVTVLPPETATPWESSPDYSQELVEQLDLRKRHSLSSLLDYRD
ncbi:MAG: hypothetical protein F6K03_17455 [Kamptonema sp. SIO4C4]|nr:hypothetical protein [Kamptonema sp. SIO4C4]